MSFLIFFVYLTICLVIYGIIGVLIYKFIIKKRTEDNFDKLLNSVFENNDNFYEVDNKTEDNKNEKIYTSF